MKNDEDELIQLMKTMSPELRAQLLGAAVDPKVFDVFKKTTTSASEATLAISAMAYAATTDAAIHEKIIRSCSYIVTLHHAINAVSEFMIPESPRAELFAEIVKAIEEMLPQTDAVFRTQLPKAVADARAQSNTKEESEPKL